MVGVSDLAEMITSHPARLLVQLGVAADLAVPGRGVATAIRLERVEPETPLANLRASKVDKLVSVRGTVTRVGTIKPLVTRVAFKCAKCGADEWRRLDDGKYDPPRRCPSEGCKGRTFELARSSAETVDFQQIKLQQRDEDVGRVPRSIDVELVGAGLVDSSVPGDVVVVAGIVRTVNADVAGGRHDKNALSKSMYLLYLDANSLYNATRREAIVERPLGQASSKKRFHALAADDRVLSILVGSLCPSIFGHHLPKLGLLLALFGTTSSGLDASSGRDDDDDDDDDDAGPPTKKKKIEDDDTTRTVRASSHVLIVGDPGMGKSQMLRAAAAAAPRSVYVCGNTTTTSGLTASVVRDKTGGALEAGALVLADRGVCALDEFDKMETSQHAGLLEAMEQQRVSISKAGVVATLSARTAVLAAANPVGGQYDKSRSIAENLSKLAAPVLSRFDLIFLVLDDPDARRDNLLSRHVLDFQTAGIPPDQDDTYLGGKIAPIPQARVLPRAFLRDYVAYATNVDPKLTTDAAYVLRSTYLRLRRDHQRGDAPATMRQLESLVRLAKARARVELRDLVTRDDARDVCALFEASSLDAITNNLRGTSASSGHILPGASDAKVVKVLLKALHAAADAHRDLWFTLPQIAALASKCGLDDNSRRPLRDYVDILRDQNYLMYQRHPSDPKSFAYKLASSSAFPSARPER
ncbi:hypothetical protein CTAYLR_009917 [Chrysophaeum taylorii]|uniref:DNA helicase n=1 Tax=Chrysophaeum taylorii TaxID=2483200 RepID=A0AAD7UCF1_9STRA|nr:hypothetical protein CTAYLR_009917 [Chrysophaeum taylorii]